MPSSGASLAPSLSRSSYFTKPSCSRALNAAATWASAPSAAGLDEMRFGASTFIEPSVLVAERSARPVVREAGAAAATVAAVAAASAAFDAARFIASLDSPPRLPRPGPPLPLPLAPLMCRWAPGSTARLGAPGSTWEHHPVPPKKSPTLCRHRHRRHRHTRWPQVDAFSPTYWPGPVYHDVGKDLFTAMHGGKLQRASGLSVLSPRMWGRVFTARKKVRWRPHLPALLRHAATVRMGVFKRWRGLPASRHTRPPACASLRCTSPT